MDPAFMTCFDDNLSVTRNVSESVECNLEGGWKLIVGKKASTRSTTESLKNQPHRLLQKIHEHPLLL